MLPANHLRPHNVKEEAAVAAVEAKAEAGKAEEEAQGEAAVEQEAEAIEVGADALGGRAVGLRCGVLGRGSLAERFWPGDNVWLDVRIEDLPRGAGKKTVEEVPVQEGIQFLFLFFLASFFFISSLVSCWLLEDGFQDGFPTGYDHHWVNPRGGGASPPKGSKIFTKKQGKSDVECDPKLRREEQNAEDLTCR